MYIGTDDVDMHAAMISLGPEKEAAEDLQLRPVFLPQRHVPSPAGHPPAMRGGRQQYC